MYRFHSVAWHVESNVLSTLLYNVLSSQQFINRRWPRSQLHSYRSNQIKCHMEKALEWQTVFCLHKNQMQLYNKTQLKVGLGNT